MAFHNDLIAKMVTKEVVRALWKLAESSMSKSKWISDTKGLLCVAMLIEKKESELQEKFLTRVMEFEESGL